MDEDETDCMDCPPSPARRPVTAVDDGWFRSHEDVRTALRYAVPGATVVFDPLKWSRRPDTLRAAAEYTVVLDGAPRHAVNALDTYVLPCKAAPLVARVQELARDAWETLARRVPCVTFGGP